MGILESPRRCVLFHGVGGEATPRFDGSEHVWAGMTAVVANRSPRLQTDAPVASLGPHAVAEIGPLPPTQKVRIGQQREGAEPQQYRCLTMKVAEMSDMRSS